MRCTVAWENPPIVFDDTRDAACVSARIWVSGLHASRLIVDEFNVNLSRAAIDYAQGSRRRLGEIDDPIFHKWTAVIAFSFNGFPISQVGHSRSNTRRQRLMGRSELSRVENLAAHGSFTAAPRTVPGCPPTYCERETGTFAAFRDLH